MSKIEFIEEGRLSSKEMGRVFGGEDVKPTKVYTGVCSGVGPGLCSVVKGDSLTVIKNCEHNLCVCDNTMQVCASKDQLSYCSGKGDKAVILPILVKSN